MNRATDWVSGLGIFALIAFLGWLMWEPSSDAQVGPPNQIQCNKFTTFTGTAAEAQILAASTTGATYICGWHVTSTSATTTTFQIFAGSGTNCATNAMTVTTPLNVTLSAPSADHIDYASLSFAAPNNALCINAPATVTGGLWVAQF